MILGQAVGPAPDLCGPLGILAVILAGLCIGLGVG
jgi:hypothetical protein